MNKIIPLLLLSAALSTTAQAAVNFTFDADTQGFTSVGWNGNGGTSWSPNHGGSLALTFNSSGWSNPLSMLGMTSNATLTTEFNNARLYGGTLTFDYIISQADLVGYNSATPPGWFELVVVGNSSETSLGANDGWDQNVLGSTGLYGGVPAGPTTFSLSLPLAGGPPVGNNNIISFQPASPFGELMFGLNSQEFLPWAGAPELDPKIRPFTSARVYLDNIVISANPVPEPTAAGLGLLALGSLALRRRRQA